MTNQNKNQVKTINSDNVLVLMGGQDYRTTQGRRDHIAVAGALVIGNGYFDTHGYAAYKLDTLCAMVRASRPTVVRMRKDLEQYWDVTPGHEGKSNRYAPKKDVLAGIDEYWNTAGSHIPSHISADNGFTVQGQGTRKRLETEPFDGDAPEWFVRGTMAFLPVFQNLDLTLAEKLQKTGIRHHLDYALVLSQMPSPSMRAKGFEYDIATLLSYTHGWASPDRAALMDWMKVSPDYITDRNKELLATGRWEIVKDYRTSQSVYVPTPFALAQVAAYLQVRRVKDSKGDYSGERLDYLPKIVPKMEHMVAPVAVQLGVNHLVGTPGMTTDNPHALVVGKTYSSQKVEKAAEPVKDDAYDENFLVNDDIVRSREKATGEAPTKVATVHGRVDVKLAPSTTPETLTVEEYHPVQYQVTVGVAGVDEKDLDAMLATATLDTPGGNTTPYTDKGLTVNKTVARIVFQPVNRFVQSPTHVARGGGIHLLSSADTPDAVLTYTDTTGTTRTLTFQHRTEAPANAVPFSDITGDRINA